MTPSHDPVLSIAASSCVQPAWIHTHSEKERQRQRLRDREREKERERLRETEKRENERAGFLCLSNRHLLKVKSMGVIFFYFRPSSSEQ